MGNCCASAPDEENDRLVRKELDSDKRKDQKVKKLLLLGAGSSGKTTFFKQLKCIHGDGFTSKDRMDYRLQIENQIIEQMQKIITRGRELIEDFPEDYKDLQLCSEESRDAAEYILELRRDSAINEEVGANISELWKDRGIRNTFAMRAKLVIPDSCEHFFNSINRISDKNYIPTDEDILLVRKRTTGIIEEHFVIKNTRFHIFDVGGQRNERKKWIHCFENVTAVVFVASLSSYDEVLIEDENVIVMNETLSLFREICNSKWFERTSFILFLNKLDLLQRKIEKVPLNVCFKNYSGKLGDLESGIEFLKNQFTQLNETPDTKEIYTHVTQATDKDNVEKVFNDVQHIVINASLSKGGLV